MKLLLQVRHVHKSFDGTHALADVSLDICAGEVHALMGENGAGKSTLMKILSGLHAPNSRRHPPLRPGGPLRSPAQAMRQGIAMIHQELMPIPDMTVAENLLLGREPSDGSPAGSIGGRCGRRPSACWGSWTSICPSSSRCAA